MDFPTPQPTDDSDVRMIQITMDGMLTAINLDVPIEGSQALETLADVFQRTIRGFLGEVYQVDVYKIGGVSVSSNNIQNDDGEGSSSDSSKKRKQRKGQHRNLQTGGWDEWDTSLWVTNEETSWEKGLTKCPLDDNQIPVLFELKVIRPCFNCDEEKANAKGAEIYLETFAVLDDAVKSGDMSKTFCTNALQVGVVTSPCIVSITCVMGTSYDVRFVDEIVETSPPTPSPSDSPSIDVTYEPSKFLFSLICVFNG